MKKLRILGELTESGVVAVIRADSKEEAVKVIEAVKAGGVKAIEITMTVPGAVEIIKDLCDLYQDEVLIGAGTVLDPETARACILAGAQYIVSPALNLDTVKLCNRYAVPCLPGIMTMTEALSAMEHGVDIVKVFPGSAFGPSIIKAFKGPIPQGNFMPTGGVNLDNVAEWIKAGAVAVGVGGDLTRGAKTQDFEQVTMTAKRFVEAVAAARN